MFFLCSSCRRQSGSPAFSYSEPYSPQNIDAGIHHKTRNYKRQPTCSGCFTLPMGYGLRVTLLAAPAFAAQFQSPYGVWSTRKISEDFPWCCGVSIPLWGMVYGSRLGRSGACREVSIPLWGMVYVADKTMIRIQPTLSFNPLWGMVYLRDVSFRYPSIIRFNPPRGMVYLNVHTVLSTGLSIFSEPIIFVSIPLWGMVYK